MLNEKSMEEQNKNIDNENIYDNIGEKQEHEKKSK